MQNAKYFFKPENAKRIENAVKTAEETTSGEIMTVIVSESRSYTFTLWLGAVLGIALASVGAWIFSRNHPWLSVGEIFLIQTLGFVLGGWFGSWPSLRRFLIPRRRFSHAVAEAAAAAFVRNGLTNTAHRTGVLIYVSAFERQVVVLGDKGIHEKVPDGFWEKAVDKFTRQMGENDDLEGLITLITEVGAELSRNFPSTGKNSDELSNQPLRR